MLLKILQNPLESPCACVSFLNKVESLKSANLLKKRLWYRCFPVNFAKFLRIYFIQNTSWWLLVWTTASETSHTKYLELIKRRSKVQEQNMSCERALNLDQWKTFSGNYKSMIVWLWLVYTHLPRIDKFTDFSLSSFKLKRGILPLLTKYLS